MIESGFGGGESMGRWGGDRWLPPHRRLVVSLVSTFFALSGSLGAAAETEAIKALSVAQAKQLIAEHDGPLDLSGLSTLPADVAAVLAEHDGDLILDGLTLLSPATAAALAAHAGAAGKVVDPEAIAARVTEAFEEGDLEISRFEEIIAEFGGDGPIPAVSLGGLSEVTPDVATALSQHLGDIQLDGLKTLSLESAQALASHVGGLSLAGIDGLDPDVAEALIPHRGDVFIPDAVLEKVTAELQPPTPPAADKETAAEPADGSTTAAE